MNTDFWSLLNIASKQTEWVLDKALPDIVLSKQSITLDSNNLTGSFIITINSTGNLSVTSSDDSIVTVSLSGNTAIVTALANGTCTITASVTESADGNYLSDSKTLLVTCNLISSILNDNNWSTISQCFTDGTATSYWNIGDTKAVTLNGDTTSNATKSFNNVTYYATLIGINHNSSYEGTGKGHFILGKNSDGKDICFCSYKMNDGWTINGGWNSSKMRNTTMGEFKNCLHADLQSVLKTVTKYTDNTGGGSTKKTSAYVTATTEQLFLLSEYEVFRTASYANPYEQSRQTQYAYYANGNSTIRYTDDSNAYAGRWWLRTPSCGDDSTFTYVTNGGSVHAKRPDELRGIAPVFCV